MKRIYISFGLEDIRGGEPIINGMFVLYEHGSPSDCVWLIPGTWIED
jgi:hypothetical protein